jgi:uncharacterized membrane protein (UPF0127 family)
VLVALASVCLLLSCGADSRKAAPPTATIGGQQVRLEIARTPGEQALGLGNRDSLSWGHGMLFVYDEPGFFTFWMKRMRFDIDIVWIRDGRVVGIAAFVPYPRENPDTPATVRAPELVDTVLEVPAGYSRAHGWRRGDTVALSGLNEKTR